MRISKKILSLLKCFKSREGESILITLWWPESLLSLETHIEAAITLQLLIGGFTQGHLGGGLSCLTGGGLCWSKAFLTSI